MIPCKTGILNLKLSNFRSYEELNLNFNSSFEPVVLIGKNGAGKTNILEAISFLAPGRGLRNARLKDIATQTANYGKIIEFPKCFAVFAKVKTQNDIQEVGTGMILGSDRRQIKIDGKSYSKQEALSTVLRPLWLTPAQDRLFCGEPINRRRFLDRLVQAFDIEHSARLAEYNEAFKEWTILLKSGKNDKIWLSHLERKIASSGIAISAMRLDILEKLDSFLNQTHFDPFPKAKIILSGFIEEQLQKRSAIMVEELFLEYLEKSRKVLNEGGTIAGPHTADFKVINASKNMEASLCSTGEQKALLISIILAQTTGIFAETGICPLLLFDEVGAHLDKFRQNALFQFLLKMPTQMWFTGTEKETFQTIEKNSEIIYIENLNTGHSMVA